jgi:hypothetical protein
MAISQRIRERIQAFAAELAEEEGRDLDQALIDEIDDGG